MNQPDPVEVLKSSTLIASKEEVETAIEALAAAINAHYGDRSIVLLIVMTGALMPAAWLASRLTMPLRMDFIHASRYAGQTEGGDIEFRVPPRLELAGEDVLIVDDIFDVGRTLEMIEAHCAELGARSVNSAVLVLKRHDRGTVGRIPAFVGMEVEDRYIFGCGMDAYEYWRQLDEIRALEGH